MTFLLDVCASSRRTRTRPARLGHDVFSASEWDPKASDEALLSFALSEQRILVTEDKDFGELLFARRLPHPCIIRFIEMGVVEQVDAMEELIEHYEDSMRDGTLIVVTRRRMRIRRGHPG